MNHLQQSSPILFDALVLLLSVSAGFIGSLIGLGGGALLVPGLVLFFGVPMKTAVATSLLAVVFTSSAAAMVSGRDALTNYRVGLLLEIVAGAASVVGALTAFMVSAALLQVIFAVVLLATVALSLRRMTDTDTSQLPSTGLAKKLNLDCVERGAHGLQIFRLQNVPLGLSIMGIAGVIAGMLGLGAGSVKVLSMDTCMKMPFRTSTVTSNFMIGATAAAGSAVFFRLGVIDPGIAGPVAVGIVPGAILGSWMVSRIKLKSLRLVFITIVTVMGVQMLLKVLGVMS